MNSGLKVRSCRNAIAWARVLITIFSYCSSWQCGHKSRQPAKNHSSGLAGGICSSHVNLIMCIQTCGTVVRTISLPHHPSESLKSCHKAILCVTCWSTIILSSCYSIKQSVVLLHMLERLMRVTVSNECSCMTIMWKMRRFQDTFLPGFQVIKCALLLKRNFNSGGGRNACVTTLSTSNICHNLSNFVCDVFAFRLDKCARRPYALSNINWWRNCSSAELIEQFVAGSQVIFLHVTCL